MSMWAESQEFEQAEGPPLEAAPLTVSAYAARIQMAVKRAGSALIEGEVRDAPRITPGGLLFFSLTDGRACITCKVFSRDRQRLSHSPSQGDLVKVRVDRPDFYPVSGQLTLIVSQVELAGEGELLKRREQLLKKLAADGLTDRARRRPLPTFPRAVGVIAGPQAVTDVVRALQDRYPPVHIVTCPAKVQGAAAPADLIDALACLQEHPLVDVIVIARGGGSVHDLLAFDDEGLCRAIFACEKPVVAAIGHTDNVPVCNHVTWSAHTPSRSAEMVVPSGAELAREIELAGGALALLPDWLDAKRAVVAAFSGDVNPSTALSDRATMVADIARELGRRAGAQLDARTSGLVAATGALKVVPHRLPDPSSIAALGSEVDRRAHELFGGYGVALDRCRQTLADAARLLSHHRDGVTDAAGRITVGTRRQLALHERNYTRALARVVNQARTGAARALSARKRDVVLAADPLARRSARHLARARTNLGHMTTVIAAHDFRRRGWLLAQDEEGAAVSSVTQVEQGERLRLLFHDGAVRSRVEAIETDDDEGSQGKA